jgi:fatty-acyl-CoA synthase
MEPSYPPFQADALGCGLRARGLRRGDRLGVWAHNCAAWPLALVAAARVGLIPVSTYLPLFQAVMYEYY